MKSSKVLKSLIIAAACAAAGAVSATPTVDSLLGSVAAPNNSGIGTETNELKSFVPGFTGTLTQINVTNSTLPTLVAGTTDEWEINLGSVRGPGYFVLKFGIGGTNVTDDTYFFKNIGESNLLVFTNAQVNYLTGGNCGKNPQNCTIQRFSHYDIGGTFDNGDGGGGGGEGGKVPEPASLALVGLGLAALGVRRRKRAQ